MSDVDSARTAYRRAEYAPEEVPLEDVLELLETAAADARYYAVRALDRICFCNGDRLPSIVAALGDALDDPDAEVRAEALSTYNSILRMEPDAAEWVYSAVRSGLNDPDPTVRNRAPAPLAKIAAVRPDAVTPVSEQLFVQLCRERNSGAAEALAHLGTVDRSCKRRLLALLEDGRERRPTVVSGLDRAAQADPTVLEGIVPRLVELLEHPDSRLRDRTLAALVRASPTYADAVRPAIPIVVDLLEDDDVGRKAGWAIGYLGRYDPEPARAAIPRLRDGIGEYGHWTNSLARIGRWEPESLRPSRTTLLELLDRSGSEASGASLALGHLATVDDETLAELKRASQRLDRRGANAMRALSTYACTDPEPVLERVPSAVAALDAASETRRTATASATLLSVVAWDRPTRVEPAIDRLERLIGDEPPDIETAATRAVAALACAEPSISVHRRTIDLLERRYADGGRRTRAAASAVLAALGERTSHSTLATELEPERTRRPTDRWLAVRALASLAPDRHDRELRTVARTDPDPFVRTTARSIVGT